MEPKAWLHLLCMRWLLGEGTPTKCKNRERVIQVGFEPRKFLWRKIGWLVNPGVSLSFFLLYNLYYNPSPLDRWSEFFLYIDHSSCGFLADDAGIGIAVTTWVISFYSLSFCHTIILSRPTIAPSIMWVIATLNLAYTLFSWDPASVRQVSHLRTWPSYFRGVVWTPFQFILVQICKRGIPIIDE